MNSYSLFELNEFIRQVLALNLAEPLWLKCELANVKISRGHCYLDLVQKGEETDEVIAQGQGVIWNKQFLQMQKKMGLQLDALLQSGMEVLLYVSVEFHERYGLKIVVENIDANYTLGKLELKRRETIELLEKDSLLEKNKLISLPVAIQRIAVISSENAAGFKDFLDQLFNNQFGYQFEIKIFPAAMQGNNAIREITSQLKSISKNSFDVVVILRGGGSRLDLAVFDEYQLCWQIANAKLPVITGIGHEIDKAVADLAANTAVKTPTAAAAFIVQHNLDFESTVLNLGLEIKEIASHKLNEENILIKDLLHNAEFKAINILQRQKMMLDYINKEVPAIVKNKIQNERIVLNSIEQAIRLLNPEIILKRGFSLTQKNGKTLKSISQLKTGDELVTFLHDGNFRSTVKKTDNEQN